MSDRSKGNPARVAWSITVSLVAFIGLVRGRLWRRRRQRGWRQRADQGRQGRGQAQPRQLGRLRRGRHGQSRRRLGDAVREEDRLPGERRQVAGTSDEMVQLMRSGQYDGISASGNASARLVDGGDVDPVNVDLVPELQDRVLGHQGPALQHVRRHPLRDSARAWGQPAGLEHRRRQARPEVVEHHPRPQGGGQVQGQDQRLRRPDLHRRRGRLSEGAPARSRDREPVRAERGTVQRAVDLLKEQHPNVGEYWSRRAEADLVLHQRRRPGRHVVAVPVLHAAGRRSADSGEPSVSGIRSRRGCDRVVGHLDDQQPGQASELHVRVVRLRARAGCAGADRAVVR